MVKRIFFGLLGMLSFIVFTFLASTGASAYVCSTAEGNQTYFVNLDGSINPNGTFCVKTNIEPFPTKGVCGYTKTGEAIECFQFKYQLTSKKTGESLSGVNLLIPSKTVCPISLVSADRSVKIREYEPSTGFSATDMNTDVITWEAALKLDAGSKTEFDVFTTRAGNGESTMELKTSSGDQYVSIDGPACCGITQTPTQINYFDELTQSTLTINYSLCNYEPERISLNGIDLELLPKGAAHCEPNPKTNAFDPKYCSAIKRLGPRSGAVILTQTLPACTFSGDYSQTCPGYAYYGFGSDIYRYPPRGSGATINVPAKIKCNDFGSCLNNITNYFKVPTPKSATIDDFVTFEYDGCGNGKIIGKNADGSQSDPITCSTPTKPIYIVPYDAAGNLMFNEASKVVAGSSEGVVLEGSSCCIIGGVYQCSYRCGLR